MCFGIWLRGFRRTTPAAPLDLLSVLVHFHPLFRPRVSPVHEKSFKILFFFRSSSSFFTSSSSSLSLVYVVDVNDGFFVFFFFAHHHRANTVVVRFIASKLGKTKSTFLSSSSLSRRERERDTFFQSHHLIARRRDLYSLRIRRLRGRETKKSHLGCWKKREKPRLRTISCFLPCENSKHRYTSNVRVWYKPRQTWTKLISILSRLVKFCWIRTRQMLVTVC